MTPPPSTPSGSPPRRPSDLALYMGAGCGYCEDVREALQELRLEIEERDAWGHPAHRAALLEARRSRRVPVLRIDHPDGHVEWMPESQDIIAYLYRRFGDETHAGFWSARRLRRVALFGMWTLLVLGGLTTDPWQSWLWVAACTVGALRSAHLAHVTRLGVHALMSAALAFGAVSIALAALHLADIPWWTAAVAVPLLAAFPVMRRARRPVTGDPPASG